MILKKIKQIINEYRMSQESLKQEIIDLKVQNKNLLNHVAELEWAHMYQNAINDKQWLKNLSISPGRMAGNYSLFYLLVRILNDFEPAKIMELGLGESSKIVSTFLINKLSNSAHIILEQDENWIEYFNSRFNLNSNSQIVYWPIEKEIIKNKSVNCYTGLKRKVNEIYDLYIVDGPFGSENFSRYDICYLAENLTEGDEFIIIIDDYHREGEKETVNDLLILFAKKKIKVTTGVFVGSKSQIIISTEKYRFATSI